MEMQLKTEIQKYIQHMEKKERSRATVEKYARAVTMFAKWLGEEELCKEKTIGWKTYLCGAGYSPMTVNTFLSALNGFLRMIGHEDCCISFLKVQRRTFADPEKELNKNEYLSLLNAAYLHQKEKAALIMETICSTGIRVSEISFITVEAVRRGRAEIQMKGKVRTILLPGKMVKRLLTYAKKEKIHSGSIFLNRRGKCMTRHQIWEEMKKICALTDINARKVFPHNLRHLFARTFYKINHDIVRLADLLGHSSIETTRIYLMTSGTEHLRQMESMGLVV